MIESKPPTNVTAFGPMCQSIWKGDCIAIIGAGFSALDYPLWPGLVEELIARCGLRAEHLSGDDPLDVAEAAQREAASEYHNTLDEIFDLPKHPLSAERYHLLSRINFSSYVTLNFDPLLAHYLNMHGNITISDYPTIRSKHHNNRELFHIHGRLGPVRPANQNNIVLTRSDFTVAYDPFQSELHGFLMDTFLYNDVCFMGCNPAESYMKKVLQVCELIAKRRHGLHDNQRPRQFLLLDDKSIAPKEFETTGIDIVEYPRKDNSFSGLDDVLSYLAKARSPIVRTPGLEKSRYEQPERPER